MAFRLRCVCLPVQRLAPCVRELSLTSQSSTSFAQPPAEARTAHARNASNGQRCTKQVIAVLSSLGQPQRHSDPNAHHVQSSRRLFKRIRTTVSYLFHSHALRSASSDQYRQHNLIALYALPSMNLASKTFPTTHLTRRQPNGSKSTNIRSGFHVLTRLQEIVPPPPANPSDPRPVGLSA